MSLFQHVSVGPGRSPIVPRHFLATLHRRAPGSVAALRTPDMSSPRRTFPASSASGGWGPRLRVTHRACGQDGDEFMRSWRRGCLIAMVAMLALPLSGCAQFLDAYEVKPGGLNGMY